MPLLDYQDNIGLDFRSNMEKKFLPTYEFLSNLIGLNLYIKTPAYNVYGEVVPDLVEIHIDPKDGDKNGQLFYLKFEFDKKYRAWLEENGYDSDAIECKELMYIGVEKEFPIRRNE